MTEISYYSINNEVCVGNGKDPAIDPSFTGNINIDKYEGFSVVRISSYAFYKCNITNITLPDSIISIGDNSFASSNIESITLGSHLIQIGRYAFLGSKIKFANLSLTKLTNSVGSSIFYKSKLEEILLPDSLEVFVYEFLAHTPLKRIKIPRSLRTFSPYCFLGLQYLNVIESDSPYFVVYDGVLYSSDFQTVYRVPSNFTGQLAPTTKFVADCSVFSGCLFSNYKVEAPLQTLGNSMFRQCYNLRNIDLSQTVATNFPSEIFKNCNIDSLILPDTLTYISNAIIAFGSLKKLVIPASVRSVGQDILTFASVQSIEYCGVYQLECKAVGTPLLYVSSAYKYSTFFGFDSFSSTLTGCLPARTPIMTPSRTPICFESVSCFKIQNFLSYSTFIVFILM